MIRAPGVVRPCRSDALVSLVDVLPTVLDLQQMNLHVEDEPLDGRSLMSIITGRTTEHRDALVLSECTWQAKRAVRTREWKYIQSWDPGIYSRYGPELYDLQNDPLEQLNVVDSRPDIARSMAEQLGSWLEKHLDGRPDPMDAVVEYGLPGLERVRRLIRVGTDQPSPPSIDLRSHPLRGERARDSALAHD
jgi:arylsulfatase